MGQRFTPIQNPFAKKNQVNQQRFAPTQNPFVNNVQNNQQAPNLVFTGAKGIVNIPAQAQLKKTETKAGLEAKSEFENQQSLESIQKLKDYLPDKYKQTDVVSLIESAGGVENASKFVNLFSALNKDTNNPKLKIAINMIDVLKDISKRIPSAEGAAGKFIVGQMNKTREFFGDLPEKTVFDAQISLVTPILLKSLGEAGNLSDQDRAGMVSVLKQLADPNKKVRQLALQSLDKILSNAAGLNNNLKDQTSKKQPGFGNFKSPDGRVFRARTKKEAEELQSLGAVIIE